MERRNFLRCANLCGVGLLGLGSVASTHAGGSGEDTAAKTQKPLTIRPYQLMCTVCSLGEQGTEPVSQYEEDKRELMERLKLVAGGETR